MTRSTSSRLASEPSIMPAMPSSPFRLLAVLLAVVLLTTLMTPAPANADPLTALAIAGGVVVVVIIVVYLIVASSKGGRQASVEHRVLLACAGDECRPLGSAPVP